MITCVLVNWVLSQTLVQVAPIFEANYIMYLKAWQNVTADKMAYPIAVRL